jgi:hypothetical protein
MPRKPKAGSTRSKGSGSKAAAAEIAAENALPSAAPSGTAVVAEAMRTGVMPLTAITASPTDMSNRGDSRLKAGDVDSNAMDNATVGDEAPGGSVMTPDQDRVDDFGRALGVQEVDSGELRTTGELLDERDRKRAQQDGPDPTTR